MNSLIRAPPQPAPLSGRNTYTSWPGGVDPSTPLFNTDNQKGGRRRNTRRRNTRRRNTRRRR